MDSFFQLNRNYLISRQSKNFIFVISFMESFSLKHYTFLAIYCLSKDIFAERYDAIKFTARQLYLIAQKKITMNH